MSIHESRDFVLEQAKQINTALANIVAMERNMVMYKALERTIRNDRNEDLPNLPE
jgi:KaiC/GvpD/RAD55 family RecA-like ATPase